MEICKWDISCEVHESKSHQYLGLLTYSGKYKNINNHMLWIVQVWLRDCQLPPQTAWWFPVLLCLSVCRIPVKVPTLLLFKFKMCVIVLSLVFIFMLPTGKLGLNLEPSPFQEFINSVKRPFPSEFEVVDFKDKPEDTRLQINKSVSDLTDGKCILLSHELWCPWIRNYPFRYSVHPTTCLLIYGFCANNIRVPLHQY